DHRSRPVLGRRGAHARRRLPGSGPRPARSRRLGPGPRRRLHGDNDGGRPDGLRRHGRAPAHLARRALDGRARGHRLRRHPRPASGAPRDRGHRPRDRAGRPPACRLADGTDARALRRPRGGPRVGAGDESPLHRRDAPPPGRPRNAPEPGWPRLEVRSRDPRRRPLGTVARSRGPLAAPQRLLWLGAFAFFLSFFLLLAVLPLYARAVGVGDRAIGGVLGAFAFASMLMRPWAGWAADRHGRRPLMLAGGLVFVVASLAYNVTAGALGLLAVRVLHGCGMGLYPTAASAVVADLAPPDRRGAVMGTFGAAANIAMALGPIAGIAITDRLGFVSVFWLAGCVAAVAVLLTRRLPETARRREKIPFTPGAMVSVEALVPSAVLFLVMLGYGALVTFLPIRARDQDVNPGLFFL